MLWLMGCQGADNVIQTTLHVSRPCHLRCTHMASMVLSSLAGWFACQKFVAKTNARCQFGCLRLYSTWHNHSSDTMWNGWPRDAIALCC